MSIATEIEQLQKNLTDSYAAVQTKGGTVPTAKGYTNLPAAITSIPTGGGGGPTWSDPHQVDTAGRLTLGNTGVANFAGIKTIADKALWRCNKQNQNVTSALFPDLEVVEDATDIAGYADLSTKASALGEAFMQAKALTTLKMPKLRKIGKAGMARISLLADNLGDVFVENATTGYLEMFPELVEVGEFGLAGAFRGTNILQYAGGNAADGIMSFPKLKTLGVQAMREAFSAYTSSAQFGFPLEILFPALETIDHTAFQNMFYNWGNPATGGDGVYLHFLPSMEETIKACVGYPNFGGNIVIGVFFDADQF